MDMQYWIDLFASYWTAAEVRDNLIVCMNVVGALLLGIVIGYERTWSGRAAGMRTYGFVCMASAALTVVVGYPASWYGGHGAVGVGGDPTRVIQGIVTGVGFLGAGMIMKEGFSISGLTTAASIWTSSAIGVLVGIGYYATAILMTFLATVGMHMLHRIEHLLPSHHELMVRLRFAKGITPLDAKLRHLVAENGYDLADATLSVIVEAGGVEWHFMATSRNKGTASTEKLAHDLASTIGVESLQVSPARN